MKKSVRLSIIVLLCASMLADASAQGTKKPAALKYERLYVGDKLPDIIFKDIINYPKKNVNVSDFSGKLLIFDFWSTSCSSCIEAFPKMEKLQQQFDDKLQIIAINPLETKTQIDKEFQRVKKYSPAAKVYLPSLPGVNGDSNWQKLFPMRSVPTHVWVDRTGIVIAITNGYNATPEHVQAVLNGERPDMALKDDMLASELVDKGYIQTTLSSMPAAYYSAFIPHYAGFGSGFIRIDTVKQVFKRAEINNDVISLFRIAFRDRSNPSEKERFIVELKNKDQYEYPRNDPNSIDSWCKKYLFTYELQIPLKDKDSWQSIMQQDVNRFFGNLFGIEGKIEKRQYKDEGIVDVLVIKDKS